MADSTHLKYKPADAIPNSDNRVNVSELGFASGMVDGVMGNFESESEGR